MGILVDYQINQLIDRGVIKGLPVQSLLASVQPNSIDVRVGNKVLVEADSLLEGILWHFFPGLSNNVEDKWKEIDISWATKRNPYYLKPRHFVLVPTAEIFDHPDDIACEFKLRSSAGRRGYENVLAGWCDSGWNNSVLTMELTNLRRWRPLPIYPGLKLGQMIYTKLDSKPLNSYRKKGRYNNDKSVQASKGL